MPFPSKLSFRTDTSCKKGRYPNFRELVVSSLSAVQAQGNTFVGFFALPVGKRKIFFTERDLLKSVTLNLSVSKLWELFAECVH